MGAAQNAGHKFKPSTVDCFISEIPPVRSCLACCVAPHIAGGQAASAAACKWRCVRMAHAGAIVAAAAAWAFQALSVALRCLARQTVNFTLW
jgi:hypothetical protein